MRPTGAGQSPVHAALPAAVPQSGTEAGETEPAIAEWSRAGKTAQARSAFWEAQESYEQAMALAEETGLSWLLARCQLGLGRLEGLEEHPAAAREHLTAAGRLYRHAGSPYWLARVDEALASLERTPP